jgi:hypothetical protein
MTDWTIYLKWLALGVLAVVVLYVVAILLFFVGGYLLSEAGRRLRASRLRRSMKRVSLADPSAQRVSTWPSIESHLARRGSKNGGTLILDHPCLGWNDLDVWWIPESVRQAAADDGVSFPEQEQALRHDEFEARMQNPIVERWCEARYLNEETGRAQLVQCTHWNQQRQRTLQRIAAVKAAHPNLETVDIYTCFLRFDQGTQEAPVR